MYEDIGKKIKTLTKVLVAVGMIISAIVGIILIVTHFKIAKEVSSRYSSPDYTLLIAGIITLIVGPVLCWIGGFFTYAFGELVDKTCEIRYMFGNLYAAEIKKQNANIKSASIIDKAKYGAISHDQY